MQLAREDEHSTFEAQATQRERRAANGMMKDKKEGRQRERSPSTSQPRAEHVFSRLRNEPSCALGAGIGRSFFCVTFCRLA